MNEVYMRRALELAERGAGFVNPNPMVGCVIVKGSRIIGEGWHKRYGELHAERNALAACTENPAGATLYVTLEPCCHWGNTPPCTEAILHHRIARVVIGCLDPNPMIAGKGVEALMSHGVKVEIGVLEKECYQLNEVFFHYITQQTPFVVMKYAMTLDGKLAAYTGDSKWVTGKKARKHVHQTRSRLMAIMVGIGTVLADDPMLNCRIEGGKNPVRIICDSQLRIPLDSQIVQSAHEIPTIIATTMKASDRIKELSEAGIKILPCKENGRHVDLVDLMQLLGSSKIDSILLEGGSALQFAALKAGIVQKVQAYIAPKLIGGAGAKAPVGGIGFAKMNQAISLKNLQVKQFGEDILLEGAVMCSQES